MFVTIIVMLLFYIFPLKGSLPEGGEGSPSRLGSVIILGYDTTYDMI